MKDNAQIYITVLSNITQNTPVEAEAKIIIEDFEKNITKEGLKKIDYWKAKAYSDFHDLLTKKIKSLQELQTDCVDSLKFLI